MQPSLSPLKDDALTAATASWVHQESVATLQVLHHLREIERRRLYAKLGYGSLYEFAIKKLKYSEGSAYRRITAMRLIKEVPEAESAIQEGKLTLSTASTLQQFLYQEQKSKAPYSAEQKREILKTVQGLSKRETERVLTSLSPGAIPRERVRPLSETETQITFVADRELMSRIERLRELLAHKNPEGSYAKTISQISEVALVELDPERKPLRTAPPPARENVAEIPGPLREFVWQRARGCCEYLDPGANRRCNSRWALQIDHVKPFGIGGRTTAENLRLVCRTHNQWLAIQSFGRQKMEKFIPGLKS